MDVRRLSGKRRRRRTLQEEKTNRMRTDADPTPARFGKRCRGAAGVRDLGTFFATGCRRYDNVTPLALSMETRLNKTRTHSAQPEPKPRSSLGGRRLQKLRPAKHKNTEGREEEEEEDEEDDDDTAGQQQPLSPPPPFSCDSASLPKPPEIDPNPKGGRGISESRVCLWNFGDGQVHL
ncbi:hypothetical protein EYF80_051737 [Liparis tanakae]|uniref:Uncharacterized protein n=1 Tax=Liparis tanakae TaxID=230148 RepID=A0A4Z2FAY6_9TELE|nr:hypothetical protein EYF80_051737 [Liparis tanakae]